VTLIDTSSLVHFLRPAGDAAVRLRVLQALRTGEARTCAMVMLELWNGAGGDRERKAIRELARLVPDLAIDADVWRTASDLARRCRLAGVTVPATDLLIEACARCHGAGLEHADADFTAIATAVPRDA
jgi:predicted nucleic acid-binding protein